MDDHAGSNEQQNEIMDKSAPDRTEQQYASMDNSNTNKSSADINISETAAVDEDAGSNNKGDDKTDKDTWSKENPVIKTFPFSENTGFENYVRVL